jgi:radical SAM protein
MNFEERPFIAIWETTQACDLMCAHCRACAKPAADPLELTTDEGHRLLQNFADARVPLVVLTGGDPAKRPDLVDLVAHGSAIGLNMALTPSATPLVTAPLISALGRAGLTRLAISIDGPNATIHDAFRGVSGSFDQSLRILDAARENGLATQINTSVHLSNIGELENIAELVRSLKSVLWSVFFVVPTGRANTDMLPSAHAVEAALDRLADIAEREPFSVKTTAAPHYRRVLLQRRKAKNGSAEHGVHGRRGMRVNDGRGFLFISHRGDIFPSGFLPRYTGNVRHDNPIVVYQRHPVFRTLRDPNAQSGKCGVCEYRNVCGGSRARGYAMTGSLLASDPLCAYVPPGYVALPDEIFDPGLKRRLHVIDA